MAYTSILDTYREIDPVKDYLPYDDRYDKELETLQEKAEEFMKQYYSAPEILKRDKEYAELNQSISNRVQQLADAINSRDLLKMKSIARQGNLLQDRAKWDAGIKKAEKLSSLIEELRKLGPNVIVSTIYDDKTPLNSISDMSSYSTQDASTYEAMGKSIGEALSNSTLPEVVGRILNNSVALLHSGKSYKEVLDMISLENSEIAKLINKIKKNSGITTEKGLKQITEALTRGITQGAKESYTHLTDPSYRSLTSRKQEEEYLRSLKVRDAAIKMINNGDWRGLEELGEASQYPGKEPGTVDWYYNGKVYSTKKRENGTYEPLGIPRNLGSGELNSPKYPKNSEKINIGDASYYVRLEEINKEVPSTNPKETETKKVTTYHIYDSDGNFITNTSDNKALRNLIIKCYNGEEITDKDFTNAKIKKTDTETSTETSEKITPYILEGVTTNFYQKDITTENGQITVICDEDGKEILNGTYLPINNKIYIYNNKEHSFRKLK